MPTFYFDIETNESKNRIVAIAFRQIYDNSALPLGNVPLTILKAWESSEKEILEQFLKISKWNNPINDFDFIPVGFELRYDFYFLACRVNALLDDKLNIKYLLTGMPSIDLKSTCVIMNKGKFPRSSWKKFIGFSFSENPKNIIEDKNWDKLVEYITYEHEKFLEFCQKIWRILK